MAVRLLFLYKIRPSRPEMLSTGSTTEEDRIIDLHFAYLQGLTEAGVVFMAGRTLNTDPSSFGIVIFSAEFGGRCPAHYAGRPGCQRQGVLGGVVSLPNRLVRSFA